MRGLVLTATVSLCAALSVPAFAQTTTGCEAFKWSVAREQKALGSADLPTVAPGEAVAAVDKGVTLALRPQAEVRYTIKPARMPKNSSAHGTEVRLPDAPAAETIQVTLSADAWADVVQGGKVLRSTGFAGRTGCPGLRKSVRFSVAAGPLSLAISDAPDATINLVVEPAE